MAVDKNKLESHDKYVNLLSKNTYNNYIKICGYCVLSPMTLLGKRGRVWLQTLRWMR